MAVALWSGVSLLAQIPGRNVNMVAGTEWPGGDPFLQRQNEPSIAASTRNPLHLVAGSNDYRTVDLPGLPDDVETGDAWLSVYKSFDGGQRWSSTLLPGYPQDTSEAGMASPIKGYQAAADPVVRAGTNGLLYYNGLVFDRGDNGKSGIFVSRFIDRNNTENGDSVVNLGTTMVAQSTGAAFLDKPWMAVDIPRGNAGWCAVGGSPAAAVSVKRNGHRDRRRGRGNQPPDDGYVYVPAGAVYVVYSSITGDGATLRSEILLKRSMDCGVTWSAPIRVSGATDPINQGASLAINPQNGHVFVAYRRFATPAAPDLDAVMLTRLPFGGNAADPPGRARGLRRSGAPSEVLDRIFEHRKKRARTATAASVSDFDQGTSITSFRTNAYPSMTFDGAGRAYIAWTERGFAAAPDRQDPVDGDARILVATTTDGRSFSTPVVADNQPPDSQLHLRGHQLMPSLAFAGGKLLLVYYDVRETRAQVFGKFVDDALSTQAAGGNGKRQTVDIRASVGAPGATPSFAPSVRVSDYLVGYRNDSSSLEQLQVNPPNLPMFKLGTVPFIGDYIDVAAAPAFVPTAGGGWAYNTAAGPEAPVFHAAWTDNRDVRPPTVDYDGDGNKWDDYFPPTLLGRDPNSLFDPSKTVGVCVPGNAGSRNQNIYTARIGGGLLVGSPGNSKQLSTTLQRGFVVFAQNQTTQPRTFRMQVLAQPPGGRASFKQLLPPSTPQTEPPVVTIDVGVPPRSTASRTLYVTSSDPRAQVAVSVTEVNTPGVVNAGLTGRVVLNPDIENPDIENPDIENPDIENTEVYNPDIENPDIENPDIENPDIENPDIENPDIENVVIANPDIENPDIENPDIENPDIENPDIENPDIENPDIENGVISDVTWGVSNTGNTTSAFNVNLFLASAGLPPSCSANPTAVEKLTCVNTQLIIYKTYTTPVLGLAAPGMPDDPNRFCNLGVETRNVLIANIASPRFVTPGTVLLDQNDPSQKNATLWLAPGELGRITLRIFDYNRANNITVIGPDGITPMSIDARFDPQTKVTPGVAAQGVDQGEFPQDPPGATEPPVVTPSGTNMDYLWQPTNTLPGQSLGTLVGLVFEPVSVRVWLNSGAPATGVSVTMSLATLAGTPVAGLSGTKVVPTDSVFGVATFPGISVAAPGTYRLLATATAAGATASGLSNAFVIGAPSIATTLSISGWSKIFNNEQQEVTVAREPGEAEVSVTYNGVSTPPTAVGAYTVVATPVAPYSGPAASVNMTIASTNSAGGPGGGPYARACSSGAFATGFGANSYSSYGLFNARLECETGGPTERFVIDNDAFNVLPSFNGASACPAGQVMVGVHGLASTSDGAGPFIKSLGARCQDRAGLFAPVSIDAVGISGNAFGPIDCPTGHAVIGVVGGAGSVLDSVALVCALVPPQAGPVSLWSAEGNANDSVGSNNGTLQGGAGYTAGRIGQAFSFSNPVGPATSQFALVPDDSSLQITNQLTMSAWIYPTGPGRGQLGEGGIILNKEWAYEMARFADGSIRSAFGNGNDSFLPQNSWVNSGGVALENTWTHVAVTYNLGVVTTFINGSPVNTTTLGFVNLGTAGYTVPNTLRIGGREYANDAFFDGRIDEVGLYNRALTPAEVLALYNAAPPAPGGTITSVSPASGSPDNFLVLRGTNLPQFQFTPVVATPTVIVSNGATTANGFFFAGPSDSSAAWIGLPAGFPTGPATVQLQLGAVLTNAFNIDVTATPSAPVITGVLNSTFVSTASITAGSTIHVQSDGASTYDVHVRFQQGASIVDVPISSSTSNPTIRLASEVVTPAGLALGPVNVSIRQGTGPFSAPVMLTVVPIFLF